MSSDDPDRKFRLLIWHLFPLVIAFGMLLVAMLCEMRRETWHEAVIASRNLVTAEVSDIEQALRIYDASLRSAAEAADEPEVLAAPSRIRQRALFDRIDDPSFLEPIRILNANGQVTDDSAELVPAPASKGELEAVAHHRLDPATGAFISLPELTGIDYVATISRRITLPDGRFGGIACGTIRLSYLTDRFRHLRIGPHDVISLFLNDEVMLAHAPGNPLVGTRITGSEVMRHFVVQRDGTIIAPGATDGIDRLFTFAHLDGWPLLVDVGVSVSDLYAPWRKRAAIVGVLLVVLVIAGGSLAHALRQELGARLTAEEAKKRSEIQYNVLADGTSDIILRLDANLVRTYASPSSRVLGYEPGDLTDRSPYDWMHPDDAATFRNAFNDARNGFSGQVIEYRVRHKDDYYSWVEARFCPLYGGEVLVILSATDERKWVPFEHEAELEELV